jgi:uncharacterized protein (AIM24 family)
MIAGENFSLVTFLYNGHGKGHVAFSAPYPGKIVPLDLEGGGILCQKNAFLCATQGVEMEIAFTKKMGAGLFGGEGFTLQRFEGEGMVFVHAGGTSIEHYLEAYEVLRVDPGCLVAFSPNIEYDIQFMGGFKNTLFGGEGTFLARLAGPGHVYLQGLPFSRLADRISTASRFLGKEDKMSQFHYHYPVTMDNGISDALSPR